MTEKQRILYWLQTTLNRSDIKDLRDHDIISVPVSRLKQIAEFLQTQKESVEDLKSVLCDPRGQVSIRGNDGDLDVIEKSLDRLEGKDVD